MKIKNILNNNVIKYVGITILSILILYNCIFVINKIITDKDYIQIFGTKIFIMQDNTMKPSIRKNALVIIKNKKYENIEEKDMIATRQENSLKIRRVTMKVGTDEIQFVVKGDNNYFNDVQYVSKNEYQGKLFLQIPYIGIIFKVFQSKIISVIILFLIIYVIYNKKIRKERRAKSRIIRKNGQI